MGTQQTQELFVKGRVVTEAVGGRPTDLLIFPARDNAQPKVLFLFLPGNPGIIEYYEAFLQFVHVKSDGLVEVVGIGHPGHSSRTAVDDVLTLEDQICHKVEFLRTRYFETCIKLHLVLAGHSIGGYMCVRMVEQLPVEHILSLRLFGVCATMIRMAESPSGVRLRPLLNRRSVRTCLGKIASLVSSMPSCLQHFFVRRLLLRKENGDYTVKATLLLMDSRCVHNILSLAEQELRDGPACLETLQPALRQLGERAVFIFSDKDNWVPSHFVDELCEAFPNCSFACNPEDALIHAFSLTFRESDIVATRIWQHLEGQLKL